MTDSTAKIDPKALYYSVEGLERLLSETKEAKSIDEETIFELEAGIRFVYDDFAETFASLKTLEPTNQITFDHLWTLYPPNTVVYCHDTLGHLQAYKVRKNYLAKDENGMPWLVLTVDYIDSNGKDVGWVKSHQLQIPWFSGVKHIWTLQYTPLELGPEPNVFRKRLIEQGRLALKRHGQQLVEYKGPGLKKGERDWFKFNVRPRKADFPRLSGLIICSGPRSCNA